jgi:hypothetical protein
MKFDRKPSKEVQVASSAHQSETNADPCPYTVEQSRPALTNVYESRPKEAREYIDSVICEIAPTQRSDKVCWFRPAACDRHSADILEKLGSAFQALIRALKPCSKTRLTELMTAAINLLSGMLRAIIRFTAYLTLGRYESRREKLGLGWQVVGGHCLQLVL